MANFDEIIGYEDVKSELRRLCDILVNNEKYTKLGVRLPNGLLLYGEPGVGKTSMAMCFIEMLGRKSFICRKNKPDGEFVKHITEVFEQAKKAIPSVIFLDDMDKYANEDEVHKNAEEFVTLQTCIDEVKGLDVFVLATANDLRDVPVSLLRAGRFDNSIEIHNPEGDDAEKIVAHYLSKKSFVAGINAKEIAGILDGKSCAVLENVVNEAGIFAGYAGKEQIGMDDILKACLRVIYQAPECTKEDEREIDKIAYHEAGHALVGELLTPGSVNLVSVRKHNSKIGGFTSLSNPDGYWYSKEKMENRVICLLGGKAATEVVFGVVDVGAESDLRRSFDIVGRFVGDYCAYGFDKWDFPRASNQSDGLLSRRENQKFTEVQNCYAIAKKLLVENRKILDKIANALMEEKIISGSRVRNIIKQTGKCA